MGITFKSRITEMLGIKYPILSGGMHNLSTAEFVSEVCNNGALGFITAESFSTPEDFRSEIRKIRTLTDKPFGVNISIVPEIGSFHERTIQLCDIACEEKVPVVETAGRSPGELVEKFKNADIKVIHKLTQINHAAAAERLGVDAVALLGYGSGGHIGLGNVASFISLPLAVSRLKIPVIAAGGICDGRGFLGALAMGAEGVLLGTRFLASHECPLHSKIKERYLQTKENETVLPMSTINNPMRSIPNKMARDIMSVEAKGATLEEVLATVRSGSTKISFETGDDELSILPVGQVVGMINELKTVKEIIEDIISEAEALFVRLSGMITNLAD